MPPQDLKVVKATEEDIPLIQQLSGIIWPQTYKELLPADKIAYMMDLMYSAPALNGQMREGHQFILVKEGDNFLAFASYGLLKQQVYKLFKIYIMPGQQGKGIGRFMINYIIEQVKPLGATSLQLDVYRLNKARNFYEKLGFKIVAEKDTDIGGGFFMNDYVMELPL